jgi:hypothetical protein
MKQYWIQIVCLTQVLFIANSCLKNDKNLFIEASIQAKADTCINIDSLGFCIYSIDVLVKNNRDSNIEFWLMTCSWEENFIFDNPKIIFYNHGCDVNFPIVKLLKSLQEYHFKAKVKVLHSLKDINAENLKFGFVLMETSTKINVSNFIRIRDLYFETRKNMIWGNVKIE